MASSGSSGRANSSGSKGFDFASDDILCSYEDYGNQDGSNAAHSEPSIGLDATKEFHKSRIARSANFHASAYSPPEESSLNQDMIAAVEKTMKKYTDNLMRFLEGISSRLSQLELYCYNLDKSIGEMRSDLVRDNGETDSRLKSVEKHLQEVHRSVQILRDKQELAETQKELAKLQLAQKESSSVSNCHQNEDRAAQPSADAKKSDTSLDVQGMQLALALPHQVAPQPSLSSRPVDQQQQQQQPPLPPQPPMPSQSIPQSQGYFLPPPQMANLPIPSQLSQGQYMLSDSQYRAPQVQDVSRMPQQPTQMQSNQTPQLPPYQQQWAQQLPQHVQQPQQPSAQPHIRPSAGLYPPYQPGQSNPPLPEAVPGSMSMQVAYSVMSQPGSSRADTMPYGYGGAARPVQPQPQPQPLPPHLKPVGAQPGDGYSGSGPHASLPTGNGYIVYEGEGGRGHPPQAPQQPHFLQSGYPPSSLPPQNPQLTGNTNLMIRPQLVRSHPYNELIEKLVNMGYRGDHVVGVIQRLEETGQPVDFNAVLDRLNGQSSGGSQRGWSG